MMQLPSSCEEIALPVAVVTGTHCSGKTTVIEDYGRYGHAPQTPSIGDVEFGLKQVMQIAGNSFCPVIVVPEAARQYCAYIGGPKQFYLPVYIRSLILSVLAKR